MKCPSAKTRQPIAVLEMMLIKRIFYIASDLPKSGIPREVHRIKSNQSLDVFKETNYAQP